MLQPTIQDLLALAEAPPQREDRVARLAEVIRAITPLDAGELVARSEGGLSRFVLAPGLGDAATAALTALGGELTFRVDTAADLKLRNLHPLSALSSILILKLEAPGASAAALVLGHARAWSFPAAPLARLRVVGNMALRLLLPNDLSEGPEGVAEIARLRVHIATLKTEIEALRAHTRNEALRKGGTARPPRPLGKPR